MKSRLIAAGLLCATVMLPVVHAESFSAGFNIADDAPPEATGLRVYPGAIKKAGKKEDGESSVHLSSKKGDSDSANIQLSFGDYGLKIIAVKMHSTDSPDKVATFYREDLARFGPVLDCTNGNSSDAPKSKQSKALTCDNDKPRKVGQVFKAGRKDNQRVVEIRPASDGTSFSLVHVRVNAPD
jgi:hypothetical protein